jgi:uncharacterized protein (DUF1778 family)
VLSVAIRMTTRHHKDDTVPTVLYLRGTPRTIGRRLKAAAALEGKSLTRYVLDLLQAHVEELERKGILPKGK